MAIQLRRGSYSNLNPNNLLPGELAVVLSGDPNTDSGTALYICFSTGEVQRFTLSEETAEILETLSELEDTRPREWSGTATSGAGGQNTVNIGETYVGVKKGDFYRVDASGYNLVTKLFFVTEVVEDTTDYFKIKPIDSNATVASTPPPSTMGDYVYESGHIWIDGSAARAWVLLYFNNVGNTRVYKWYELTDPVWDTLATVDVEDLSETPDGFVWDVDDYDDIKIIAKNLTAVTGNRNFVLKLTSEGGASDYFALFPNKITQTARDIETKIKRNSGTTTVDVHGSLMTTSYPYINDATYDRTISLAAGKITKVELIIGNGGGLATGDITLLGRKRG